jgi:hypothetical protein
LQVIAYWVFRSLLLSAFICEICGQESGSSSPIGSGTCGVGQLTASGFRTRGFIDQETSARKPPRNCKVGGEKARRKVARQLICRSASPSSILSQLLIGINQPQISCPQISQMNADGENHRDVLCMVRLADSAIIEVAIRWSSGISRLTDA